MKAIEGFMSEHSGESVKWVTPTMNLRFNDGILEQLHTVQWHSNGCLPGIAQHEWIRVPSVPRTTDLEDAGGGGMRI